jgi:hypothetical protein
VWPWERVQWGFGLVWVPIMHRMSNLILAWQLQSGCGHVHVRSQFGIVWSGGWLVVDFTGVS